MNEAEYLAKTLQVKMVLVREVIETVRAQELSPLELSELTGLSLVTIIDMLKPNLRAISFKQLMETLIKLGRIPVIQFASPKDYQYLE